MPNPYHDAEGKFCSKGEMRAAVDNALKAGDIDSYFTLRTEYEAIAKESIAATEDQAPQSVKTQQAENSEDNESKEQPYPDGTLPSQYSGKTNFQDMQEHDLAIKNAEGEYNSYLGGYDFPDKTFISSFYYPGRGDTYGVYPSGKSMWSSGYRAPKFGNIQDALKAAGLSPADTTPDFVSLSRSNLSDHTTSEIAEAFQKESIVLNDKQKAVVSHIFYHLYNDGYEEGADAEEKSDSQEIAENTVAKLKLPEGVVVPSHVYSYIKKKASAIWEAGVYDRMNDQMSLDL